MDSVSRSSGDPPDTPPDHGRHGAVAGGATGGEPWLHVVLVAPEIHWNAGNVGRTCLAAGARLHLVRPLGFRLTDRRLRRAGLDYWRHVDLQVWDSWSDLEPRLAGLGQAWFFTPEADRSFWGVDYGAPAALIFGGEGAGLSAAIRAPRA